MTDATPSLVAKSSLRSILLPVLLFVLAILPFLPALRGEFTWDDDMLLVDSAQVHAWNGLHLIWNPLVQPIQYFPLSYTSFWLEYKMWALNPLGYHLDNMLLQAGGAVVLWLALRRLGLRAAWLAALLWAIHPVQAESVAWVAERKNTLSGLFYMLAAWSYLRFERIGDPPAATDAGASAEGMSLRGRDWRFYAVALAAFLAALLSKTLVCTFPAGMAAILWWKRDKISWRLFAPLLPFLVAAFALAAITALQEHRNMIVGGASDMNFTALQRIIIAGKNVWFYIGTLLWPFPLMPIYPRWTFNASFIPNYLPALGVVSGVILLFAFRRGIGKWPLAAFIFFLVTLSPLLCFINFYTMHYTFVADHYQYLACLGVLVPIAELLVVGGRRIAFSSSLRRARWRRFAVAACGVILFLGLMSLTAFYASLFQTNMKLWTWNVERNPAAFTAQHNLGVAYLNAGNNSEGIKHIQIALREQPNDDAIQRSVGKLELSLGHDQEALAHFQKALSLRPTLDINYLLLGDVYEHLGRSDEALSSYEQAIAVGPIDPQAYLDYAIALKKVKKYDKAAKAYLSAISFAPGNMVTRYNYANLLLDMNKFKPAIEQYEFILRYDDKSPLVWHNLAVAYYRDGQMDQAIAAKNRADAMDAQLAAAAKVAASRPKP